MLSPDQIVRHLQDCLPLLTDRFHDKLPVTSGSVSSGILTLSFPEEHGMVSGEIFINRALIKNRIVSVIENSDNTISYITEHEHDLTAYSSLGHGGTWPEGLRVTLSIDDIITEVELVPDPSSVPHTTEFVGKAGSVVFVPSGDEYLLENRSVGLIGFKTILSVPTPTTLTIDLSDVPPIPDGDIGISDILINVRVAHVSDIQRAEEIYTSQGGGNAWLFVIMLDRVPSKDRANSDDFTSLPGSSLKNLDIEQDFSTVCFVPTSDDLGASSSKSWTYKELFIILGKCLHGWENTGYNGDGQALYTTAYYAQVYGWQSRVRIDFRDGYQNRNTVALRRVEFTQTIFDQGVSNGSIEYPE